MIRSPVSTHFVRDANGKWIGISRLYAGMDTDQREAIAKAMPALIVRDYPITAGYVEVFDPAVEVFNG